jgi:hypothetical protein
MKHWPQAGLLAVLGLMAGGMAAQQLRSQELAPPELASPLTAAPEAPPPTFSDFYLWPPNLCCTQRVNCYCGACYPSSGWYATAEFLALTRDNRTNQPAVVQVTSEANAAPGTLLAGTGSLTFGMQPGVSTLLGYRCNSCDAFELSYFGIYGWQANQTIVGANNLALPGALGASSQDLFAADQMTLRYRSQIDNVEANFVRSYGNLSLLGGFRYLDLNEKLEIQAIDANSGTGYYRTHATNNLFGGQIGARYRVWWDRFGWDATGKAGAFGNYAQESQTANDSPMAVLIRTPRSATGGQAAFVGDLNVSGFYQLSPVWSLRAGYNVLWIEGVALAPNQVDYTNTPNSGRTLHMGSGVFAHGVNIGLMARW